VIAIGATLCATVVGWGLQALGFHPFTVLGTVVLVNNLVVASILSPLLLAVLYPRIRHARLLYRDILGARPRLPRWRAALGVTLVATGTVAAFVAGELIASGRWLAPWATLRTGSGALRSASASCRSSGSSSRASRSSDALSPCAGSAARIPRRAARAGRRRPRAAGGRARGRHGRDRVRRSTLARCLTRIVPCFVPGDVSGDVRLLGEADRRPPGRRARGDDRHGVPGLRGAAFSTDVTQEVVFGLEHTGVPPAEMPARVTRRARRRARGVRGPRPTTLSGGEKQRLAIAGLLAPAADHGARRADDRPRPSRTGGGRARPRGIARRELTLVVIEHDTAAAADADLLLLLQEGRVVACGEPRVLLADVETCAAAGVRAPDVCRVFAALGFPDPPLDVDAAADRLRAEGIRPRPPHFLPRAAPSGPPAVEVHGLGHRYQNGHQALADVSLRIGRGEFVALVGPNGSGKTTLAKHLNGLLAPGAGHVRVMGRDIAGLPLEELAQQVGYVFQDPDHQLFASSVGEEVAFGPQNLGLPPDEVEARVDEALRAVGLRERDADPFLLDKGVRQRLAVAAVLAPAPASRPRRADHRPRLPSSSRT
jgi:energy-coupling factor transport system ATP-binding protein